MLVADLTMNMIEFFDDASNVERRQVPQSACPPGSGGASRMAKVFRPTRLNILPRCTFLIMDEVMLSESMSTPKRSLARLIISEIWSGSLVALSMSYAMLICDLLLSRGARTSWLPSSRRNALMAFSCDLRTNSWNFAHSLISIALSFLAIVFNTIISVCQVFYLTNRQTTFEAPTG